MVLEGRRRIGGARLPGSWAAARAARRLHLRPRVGIAVSFSSCAMVTFLGGGGGKKAISSSSRRRRKAGPELSFRVEGGVWRKEILMEERCQSLDFSGMIYYDVAGRRLEQPPPPRALLHSPLPSSIKLVANAAGGY